MSNLVPNNVVALKPNQSPLALTDLTRLAALAPCGSEFESVRADALRALTTHGIPSALHELWRYTQPSLFKVELASDTRKASTKLCSKIPAGIEMLRGADAFAALQKAKRYIPEDPEASTLGDLCDATCSEITLISVKPGAVVAEPISLQAIAQTEGCASRFLAVVVGRGASATIIDDLTGTGRGLELERVELVLGANARGLFVHTQEYGDDVRYYGRHRITADRDVDFTCLYLALGGRVARLDIDLMLPAPGSSVNLLGVVVADGKRHVDFHPNQRHLAPHCRSDLFLKTVVKDRARSVYYGYIKVSEGAQKTDAYQTNRNLVLSNDARADTIPNLEIKANDVKCSHGASVTNVGVEDMFYLQARGLPPSVAQRLLVGGFLEDVLARFPDEGLREGFAERIGARLDRVS